MFSCFWRHSVGKCVTSELCRDRYILIKTFVIALGRQFQNEARRKMTECSCPWCWNWHTKTCLLSLSIGLTDSAFVAKCPIGTAVSCIFKRIAEGRWKKKHLQLCFWFIFITFIITPFLIWDLWHRMRHFSPIISSNSRYTCSRQDKIHDLWDRLFGCICSYYVMHFLC